MYCYVTRRRLDQAAKPEVASIGKLLKEQLSQLVTFNNAPRKTQIKLPLHVSTRKVSVRLFFMASCVCRLLQRESSPRRDIKQCSWTSEGQLESQGAQHEQ